MCWSQNCHGEGFGSASRESKEKTTLSFSFFYDCAEEDGRKAEQEIDTQTN